MTQAHQEITLRWYHFPSPGRCIYCGLTDVDLTDEHIFPYALCGTYIFKRASCKVCAAIINKEFEQVILRTTFRTVRATLKTFSRSKDNPKTYKALINVGDDPKNAETVEVPVDDLPWIVIPYQPFRPPLLEGLTKGPDRYNPNMARLDLPGAKKLKKGDGFTMVFVGGALERLLAKIAHGFACARGYNFGLCELLPKIILTGVGFSAVVGKSNMELNEFQRLAEDEHAFNKICFQRQVIGSCEFMIAQVQLFSPYNFPPFEVVVGRRSLNDQRHNQLVNMVRTAADWVRDKPTNDEQLVVREDAQRDMWAYDRAYKGAYCDGSLENKEPFTHLSSEEERLEARVKLDNAAQKLIDTFTALEQHYPLDPNHPVRQQV